MGFAERLSTLAGAIPDRVGQLTSQQATRDELVLPFVAALGYDVSSLQQVVSDHLPPFAQEGRQPDFAIAHGDGLTMVFMVVKVHEPLTEHDGDQLKFHLSLAYPKRIGVLTNGIRYEFFGDLVALNQNKPTLLMLNDPFLVVDMLALSDQVVANLGHLASEQLDLKALLAAVRELDDVRKREREGRKAAGSNDDPRELARWTERAAAFAGVVSRAYAGKDAPSDVLASLCQLWDVAARVSRAECERYALTLALERLERRAEEAPRALGLDDIREQQARASREAAAHGEQLARIDAQLAELERTGAPAALLQAKTEDRQHSAAQQRESEDSAQALKAQLDALRGEMSLYAGAAAQDLANGNSKLAERERTRDQLEKEFDAASGQLLRVLNDEPTCRQLLADAMAELDATRDRRPH